MKNNIVAETIAGVHTHTHTHTHTGMLNNKKIDTEYKKDSFLARYITIMKKIESEATKWNNF